MCQLRRKTIVLPMGLGVGGAAGGAGLLPSGSGDDKTVWVWEVGSGRLVRTLSGHSGSVWALAGAAGAAGYGARLGPPPSPRGSRKSPAGASARHRLAPPAGRAGVSLQLHQGLSIGTAAVSHASPGRAPPGTSRALSSRSATPARRPCTSPASAPCDRNSVSSADRRQRKLRSWRHGSVAKGREGPGRERTAQPAPWKRSQRTAKGRERARQRKRTRLWRTHEATACLICRSDETDET